MARIVNVDENDLAAALAMVQWHHPSMQLYKIPQYPLFECSLLSTLDTNFRIKMHHFTHTHKHGYYGSYLYPHGDTDVIQSKSPKTGQPHLPMNLVTQSQQPTEQRAQQILIGILGPVQNEPENVAYELGNGPPSATNCSLGMLKLNSVPEVLQTQYIINISGNHYGWTLQTSHGIFAQHVIFPSLLTMTDPDLVTATTEIASITVPDTVDTPNTTSPALPSHQPQGCPCKSVVKTAMLDDWKASIEKNQVRLTQHLNNQPPAMLAAAVCLHACEAHVTDPSAVILEALEPFNRMQTRINVISTSIYRRMGCTDLWKVAEKLCSQVQEVVNLLQDLLCSALSGISELRTAFNEGTLAYQQM
ncbi:uncharacterized protein EV420DRAFT_1487497 [Desarmillaria tabescens]|uniref:Uncharacterized protein n=1 Tax=Armillaria tabescens TaxID=1929756 RepID=A0AA39J6Q2_ARMTA|nr:uncharacterized protein EV420DRAFT_1487497 [Desarmillaria tabescens]KAK0436470.1 hypothetical protein EV420DRAFT_1487497 [Desarmillaria tabescens]